MCVSVEFLFYLIILLLSQIVYTTKICFIFLSILLQLNWKKP